MAGHKITFSISLDLLTNFPFSRSVCGCSSERGVTNRYRALMPCHSGMKLFETPSPSSRLLIHIWMPNKRKNLINVQCLFQNFLETSIVK